MASIHGTVSTILAVQSSAPCSPCMNWLRLQLCCSTPHCVHSLDVHLASGVPVGSKSMASQLGSAPLANTAMASGSTSIDQSRSVSPFHCEFLAFS